MTKAKPEFVGGGGGHIKFKLPGSSLRSMAIGICGILIITLAVMYFSFLEYVRPNEYGIKEIQIGINRGIQEEVYPPGLAFVIPKLQIMHRLPRSLQVLEMTNATGQDRTAARESDSVRHSNPANIQTSDGFFVTVDASILYRIENPYLVVTKLGTGDKFFTTGLHPKAEPILKTALGQLTTEEFYNSEIRVAKAEHARDLLDEQMEEFGISVEHVLVRYFKYSESIQANIEAKKLQDQMVFKNQSKRKAAEAQQALNRTIAEGKKNVTVTLENGDAYRVERQAEQDLYVRRKNAEADLLIALAEAQSTELKNEALEAQGVDRKVALKMAEVLKGIELLILPSGGEGSLNPLDLSNTANLFGVQTENVTPLRNSSSTPTRGSLFSPSSDTIFSPSPGTTRNEEAQ